MKHVFLFPHLDDAIACCGGTIAKLVSAGEKVIIHNLFSAIADPPFSSVAIKLHELWGNPHDVIRVRRSEDKAAAAQLGVLVHFEDLTDSIYRKDQRGNWMYGADKAIFGPRHLDDN